jgi:hypothetical protein
MIKCSSCGAEKNDNEFHSVKVSYTKCKECRNITRRKQYEKKKARNLQLFADMIEIHKEMESGLRSHPMSLPKKFRFNWAPCSI